MWRVIPFLRRWKFSIRSFQLEISESPKTFQKDYLVLEPKPTLRIPVILVTMYNGLQTFRWCNWSTFLWNRDNEKILNLQDYNHDNKCDIVVYKEWARIYVRFINLSAVSTFWNLSILRRKSAENTKIQISGRRNTWQVINQLSVLTLGHPVHFSIHILWWRGIGWRYQLKV